MKTLMISGSRNTEGQTARAAKALLSGVAKAGDDVESVFLPSIAIERCRQCQDDGWGLCRRKGRCVIEDDFHGVVEKIGLADSVVFATPVYYSDLSESLRAFLDRLRRICAFPTTKEVLKGKPAVGVCVAGGGGGGAPECCARLTTVLTIIGFDVVDMIPVRRQNLEHKLGALSAVGERLHTPPVSR